MIVLDEPTSALDVHTEAAVRDAISRRRGRSSVIVIAHRLSTLRDSDRVAVIVEGRLAGGRAPRGARPDRWLLPRGAGTCRRCARDRTHPSTGLYDQRRGGSHRCLHGADWPVKAAARS